MKAVYQQRISAMLSGLNNAALHQTVQCSTSQLLIPLAASAAHRGDSAISDSSWDENDSLKSYRIYAHVSVGPIFLLDYFQRSF